MEYEQFAPLVAPHMAAMAHVAAALVGTADGEDAAQEALLRAWQHWPSLRDASAVRTWLLRITVNVCHNWQSGHFGTTLRLNESLDFSAREHMPAPVLHGDDAHEADALDLRQAITILSDDLRRVIALRFYAGLDSTQIGAVLDVPAATVRTRLRRALELLRANWKGATRIPHAHAGRASQMANQRPNAETARDLKALPVDLHPLYQRLADDGAIWQAASAEKLASLAQSLVAEVERIASDSSLAAPARDTFESVPIEPSNGTYASPLPMHRHRRGWIAGALAVVAAVVVVGLLALVLQGAFAGRNATGATTTLPTATYAGPWQILDRLTVKGNIWTSQAPIFAPSNPQVVYEATNSVIGQASKVVTYASLRRTEDGGATWQQVKLPLPVDAIESIQLQISPSNARTIFMSIWERTSTPCEGCTHGYISYDGGDSWQMQQLPVSGILDLNLPLAIGQSRMFARNICNAISCIHLLMSTDGGRTWQVIDDQLTSHGNHVCAYAATPYDANVYAVTTSDMSAPQIACSLPANDTTLWRNDDAGSQGDATATVMHWIHLGPLPPTRSISTMPQRRAAIGGVMLVAPTSGLVYLTVAHWSDGSDLIYLSEDYGKTWKLSVPVPAGMEPGLQVESSATMHDGTMIVAIQDGRTHVTLYRWKPGDTAWTRLPPLPGSTPGGATVTAFSDGKGRDTILVTLFTMQSATTGTWHVVRYQM